MYYPMPSEEHEKTLLLLMDEMFKKGYKVIRLDKRIIPDAIAIDFENKKVISLEATTSNIQVYFTRGKYPNEDQYDEVLICKPITKGKRIYYPKSYRIKALELYKQGMSMLEIQRKLNVKGYATIHRWIKHDSRRTPL